MLTDEQLEVISDALIPLFQYLEHEVIVDVARRIQETLTYSRTAEIEAQRLQQLGFSPARIRREAMKLLKATPEFRKSVAKNTLEHKRKVKQLLKSILKSAQLSKKEVLRNAAELSQLDNLNLWKTSGKKITDSSFLPQLTEAISRQTADALVNLTQTTGFKTMLGFEKMENLYTRELDKAMIKVCTGTFSMETVVYDTVRSLAKSGLRTIDFASGYSMQLDTAVKLAVRTGANQLSGKIMDADIERTGENLVYVSRHWGARNTGEGHANHRAWQGQVYYIKPGRDYKEEAARIGQASIQSLWEATGYSADGTQDNDPLGLYGYNCRHRHYIWFEGASKKLPEDPEPEPVTIDGKTYDYYAISQRMRAKERGIRALKREREALKSLEMDTKEINGKIKHKTKEYKDFCEAAGVKADINRLRYECGTSDLTKTKAWAKYKQTVDSDEKKVADMTQIVAMGTIDKQVFLNKYGKLQTDEVIVTGERLVHIQERHPEDYNLFIKYGKECIEHPDLIISDENNIGTVSMIKKLDDTNMNVIIRLVLEGENSMYKNSVMTFWRIRDKNVAKLIKKNEILYKRE